MQENLMKLEGKIIALHLLCAIQNLVQIMSASLRITSVKNGLKCPRLSPLETWAQNWLPIGYQWNDWLFLSATKANKLLGNLIGLIVKRCPGVEYPARDEVSKQNPTSDLQEQSILQPTLLLSPFSFATEKNTFA